MITDQRLQQFLGGDYQPPLRLPLNHPVITRLIHSIMRFFVVWKFLWQDESMQAMYVGSIVPSIAVKSGVSSVHVCLRFAVCTSTLFMLIHLLFTHSGAEPSKLCDSCCRCCSTVIVRPVVPHLPAVLDSSHTRVISSSASSSSQSLWGHCYISSVCRSHCRIILLPLAKREIRVSV